MEMIIYLLTGAVAGSLAGLLGVGGGIIVVPALAWAFTYLHFPPAVFFHMAVGTSLAIMIITGLVAVRSYAKQGNIVWPIFFNFLPLAILASIFGVWVTQYLSSRFLSIAFGLFLLYTAAKMFLAARNTGVHPLPHKFILAIFGGLLGFISALFGVGAGSVSVPFLAKRGVPMRKASGVTTALGTVLAIVGSVSYIIADLHTITVPYASGYIYWPAVLFAGLASLICTPIAAHYANRLPNAVLKRIFAVFLCVIGVLMLLGL